MVLDCPSQTWELLKERSQNQGGLSSSFSSFPCLYLMLLCCSPFQYQFSFSSFSCQYSTFGWCPVYLQSLVFTLSAVCQISAAWMLSTIFVPFLITLLIYLQKLCLVMLSQCYGIHAYYCWLHLRSDSRQANDNYILISTFIMCVSQVCIGYSVGSLLKWYCFAAELVDYNASETSPALRPFWNVTSGVHFLFSTWNGVLQNH